MDLISKLEKRFGSWAIPHLTLYIIAIQAIGVVLLMSDRADFMDLLLHGSSVMDRGQWWRLLSFMMLPKTLNPIWLFFAFFVFYLIGNSLEQQWGAFRFNLFILSGYLLTVAMAFINPGVIITNTYFLGCVFLAFATLFPNMEFRIYFILPVKVKWLAWITVGFYILNLFSSDIGARLGVTAAFINYGLFFGKDLLRGFKAGQRKNAFVAQQTKTAEEPMHVCTICGKTELSHPELEFRYSSSDGACYCEEHINTHKH
ncbi:hypothetical protein EGM51_05965 [Verrucomicrobia bacterium S94]|nr:hypothetical protein EGM51_05965 [Verrucomicrobia bacterium S94]